jgi:Fic family protein
MTVTYHTGKFPPDNLNWAQIIPHIGPAQAALARYDGILQAIPNAQVLLAPLTAQEAVLSSKIEGTQATLGEVLRVEAGDDEIISPDKRNDVEEILNYRTALSNAVNGLSQLPLSQRLLREAHATLLQGVRGRTKDPGNYRRDQNWIGTSGATVDSARFIPISPEQLNEGMSQWEKFIHTDFLDSLVQLAIIHAEFEALHPFKDGNGRLGRLLIPLFLFEKRLLSAPSFYMSAYLEGNREIYYDQLLNISASGDWTPWCCFFLEALKVQAEDNGRKAKLILDLYDATKQIVIQQTQSKYAIPTLDFIFQVPVFNSTDFVQRTTIPDSSARRILTQLKGHSNLLTELRPAKGSQPSLLAFGPLINIAEGAQIV